MTKKIFNLTTRVFIVATLFMASPGTVLADGGAGGYETTANGYHIMLVFSEPAKTGVNEFHVLVTDTMGMPVSNAEVEVIAMPKAEMPDHAEESSEDLHDMELATETPVPEDEHGMSGMDMSGETETNTHEVAAEVSHQEELAVVTLAAGHEAGEYTGEIHLDASGDWSFKIHFTVGGQMTKVEIPVEVARTISNYGILAGFFGINATVIAAASIIKRKSISPKA